ncbi:uncharacterized protein LOC113489088 [Athene cunicularia]|uniref:uncharacterized protein LOC113489088 n=1 Tax=Athene cunicularia TaxID=194338 RepID=UPI000EF69A4D|nr:uncharacterized protein LOC113489088 [Athene cunicularia]
MGGERWGLLPPSSPRGENGTPEAARMGFTGWESPTLEKPSWRRRKAAPSAPASSLHPEQSESRARPGRGGRTQRPSRGGWRAEEHPLSTPRGARQPPPHRLLARHAGYFHPDVFCHHRPGDPLLHHLHALEPCRGRCGSASASPSKRRPATAWATSLGAFWNSINPRQGTGCPRRSEGRRGGGPGGRRRDMGWPGRGDVPLPGRGCEGSCPLHPGWLSPLG